MDLRDLRPLRATTSGQAVELRIVAAELSEIVPAIPPKQGHQLLASKRAADCCCPLHPLGDLDLFFRFEGSGAGALRLAKCSDDLRHLLQAGALIPELHQLLSLVHHRPLFLSSALPTIEAA